MGTAGAVCGATQRHDGNHQEGLSKDPRRFKPVAVVPLPAKVDITLPALPRGVQTLAGLQWNIKTAPEIVKSGGKLELPVTGTVGKIWVLQTAAGGADIAKWRAAVAGTHISYKARPDYPVIGRYVLTYADKTTVEIPLRWGEGIENAARRTFEPVSRFVSDMGWAKVAWQGELDPAKDEWPVAYATQIVNPLPDKPLAGVRFETAAGNWGELAVFAVQADKTMPKGRYIFVAPSGNNANPGTFAQPVASPQVAADLAQPGDTIWFRAGEYAEKAPVMPLRSGTADAWITYSGFPGEMAILKGNLLYTDNGDPTNEAGNYYAVQLGDEKVEMLASRTGTFHIFKRAYIRVQNLSVHDSNFVGISVDAAHRNWMEKHDPDSKRSSHHINLLFNRVYRTVHAGIGVFANFVAEPQVPVTDVRALGNQVHNAYDYGLAQSTTGPGHQADTRKRMQGIRGKNNRNNFGDENLDFHGVHRLEVGYNEIFVGGKEGIDLMIGTRQARVHHNYVHENFVYPHFGGGKAGIYLDTRRDEWDIEVDHNVTRQCGEGIVGNNEDGCEGRDIRVHHNLTADNRWGGLRISANPDPKRSEVHRVELSNNTSYKEGYYDANTSPTGSIRIGETLKLHTITVRRNIAVDSRDYAVVITDKTDLANRNILIEKNLIWPGALAEEKKLDERGRFVRHNGQNAVVADPLFYDPANWNFNLRPESPARTWGAFPATPGNDSTWRTAPIW